MKADWLQSIDDVRRMLPDPPAKRYAEPMTHGTMRAGLYAPRGTDDQKPHAQDELYVIVRGTGVFDLDGARRPFGPGDLIFVPAGKPHRFAEFTEDFETWAIFWGPEGGEA